MTDTPSETPTASDTPTETLTETATGSETETPTITETPTPTSTPQAIFASAEFVHDGDGARVKQTFMTDQGEKTTYFVGTYYEVADGVVTKYYYAGGQRIAMRANANLAFLLGDHLGSTSITTDDAGTVLAEQRYDAWGQVRFDSGDLLTKYTYTGQYTYAGDFGLSFYNARWYDATLGRFAQADIVVTGGVQGLDRYAYVANNPLRYTDPSGNMPCNEQWGCDQYGPATKTTATQTVTQPTSPISNVLTKSASGKETSGRGGGVNLDPDNDGIPNHPDPSFPAIQMGRSVQADCLPGNLVECYYDRGLMPAGDYDITLDEYRALMLAISYDIQNQHPLKNYELRGIYDTPFFNAFNLSGTICIAGSNCRSRSEYNYIAQGEWSAAALEGKEGMILVVAGWKWHEYGHLPSYGSLLSASEGFDFYESVNPINSELMRTGLRNYYSAFTAAERNWQR